MSGARFEIVRVDGGYFARFVAANNRVVWVTPGLLSRRRTAYAAIESVAREFIYPTPVAVFHIEVRDIDEREATS